MTLLDPRHAWLRQLAAVAVLLALWEAAGGARLLDPLFAPVARPGAPAPAPPFAPRPLSPPPPAPLSASPSPAPWSASSSPPPAASATCCRSRKAPTTLL